MDLSEPRPDHIAVAAQHPRMVIVRRARGLQNIVARVADVGESLKYLGKFRISCSQRNRRPAATAVLDVHVVDPRAVGRNLHHGIMAEGGAVADIIIDPEGLLRK